MENLQKRKPSRNEVAKRAEEELNGYRAKALQILRLRDKKREIEADYSTIRAFDYSKLRVQGGMPYDGLVATAIRWADLCTELDDLICESEKSLLGIEKKLRILPAIEQTVLFKYYIEARSIVDISILTGYSVDGVKRVKMRALRKYGEIEP